MTAETGIALPLLLEQRIPLFPSIVAGRAGLAHQVHMRGRLEIIAVVGPVLVAHPLGLVFPALVVNRGIEKPAIPADMHVRLALGAGIIFQDLLRGNQLHRMTALEAGKGNLGHGRILPRPGSHFSPAPKGRQTVAHGPAKRDGIAAGIEASPVGATDRMFRQAVATPSFAPAGARRIERSVPRAYARGQIIARLRRCDASGKCGPSAGWSSLPPDSDSAFSTCERVLASRRRQGTTSVVPPKPEEEGGFSR